VYVGKNPRGYRYLTKAAGVGDHLYGKLLKNLNVLLAVVFADYARFLSLPYMRSSDTASVEAFVQCRDCQDIPHRHSHEWPGGSARIGRD
jgi:hypothetical protein